MQETSILSQLFRYKKHIWKLVNRIILWDMSFSNTFYLKNFLQWVDVRDRHIFNESTGCMIIQPMHPYIWQKKNRQKSYTYKMKSGFHVTYSMPSSHNTQTNANIHITTQFCTFPSHKKHIHLSMSVVATHLKLFDWKGNFVSNNKNHR